MLYHKHIVSKLIQLYCKLNIWLLVDHVTVVMQRRTRCITNALYCKYVIVTLKLF